MVPVQPGDIVEWGSEPHRSYVVVDVSDREDGSWAVLRAEADLEGEVLTSVPVEELTVIGHFR